MKQKHGLSNEAHHDRNQPNNAMLVPQKSLKDGFNDWVTRQSASVIKVGVAFAYWGI